MEIRSLPMQALGALATLIAAAVYALLLDRVRRTLATRQPWWASSARDLVNMGGFLAFIGSFYLFGFALPRALFLGFALCLSVYALDYAASLRLARPPRAVVPLSTLLVTPLLVFSSELASALDAVLPRAFPL